MTLTPKVRDCVSLFTKDNTLAHPSGYAMKEASEMSDLTTGKQLALARRQASCGKSALQPQAVKSNVGEASSESVPATCLQRAETLMSQTEKRLSDDDRTRISTHADQSCDCESSPKNNDASTPGRTTGCRGSAWPEPQRRVVKHWRAMAKSIDWKSGWFRRKRQQARGASVARKRADLEQEPEAISLFVLFVVRETHHGKLLQR